MELILKYGSIVYNKAIKDSHPESIQISDRFHILKNLTDYCKQYLERIFKNKVEIGKLENINQEEILRLKEKYKLHQDEQAYSFLRMMDIFHTHLRLVGCHNSSI